MKPSIYSIVSIIFFLSLSANAERWIVENAKRSTMKSGNVKIVGRVSFGEKEFTILETKENSINGDFAFILQSAMGADAAFPDLMAGFADSNYPQMSQSNDAWHVKKMSYNEIHKAHTGKGVIVAVLDSGVDYNHTALKNKIWKNQKEIAGNGIDDDHNGYVDDVIGYDFDARDENPMDILGHGTHCAGIIAADIDAKSEAQGIAPEVSVMPLRVIGDDGLGFLSNAALAIKYAVDNGAKILSNSWRVYKSWNGYVPNDKNIALLQEAILYAEKRGVIFVAAAGNESSNIGNLMNSDPIFPVGFQSIPLLVGVASSDKADSLSDFSNYGRPYVRVVAPGTEIVSTYLDQTWESMSGTSMATPLVAGSLALGLESGLSPKQAVMKLVSSSDKFTKLHEASESEGIINVLNFVK